MSIVNIGILAHVDAGKTTLTERILFETGVIAAAGSVDKGTTQTDTLELERARGITIKSAVVSFQLNDLKVNLIDTPGHADFVAEVERCLAVLDGVVLVVSAVEGVQPRTRRLADAVRDAGLPLLIFINKIDRLGARTDALLDDLRRKLRFRIVPMNEPRDLGARTASVEPFDPDDTAWRVRLADALAESSEAVIAEFERTGGEIPWAFIEAELRRQTARGEIAPVFFGSAMTGAGVRDLLGGVPLLPPAASCPDQAAAARIFKIMRRPSGEKVVYARMFKGTLAVRERVTVQRRAEHNEWERFEERITGVDRFLNGAAIPVDAASGGEIVRLHGLRAARIGDMIGDGAAAIREPVRSLTLPLLESVIRAVDPAETTRLRAALENLAEQDPLISLRQRDSEGEITVRLYGDVQKEVIAETLRAEFGVEAVFGPSRTICVERPVGIGSCVETMSEGGNPFYATVGLRVEPGPVGSGIDFVHGLGLLPLAFYRAIEETVHDALSQGLFGWQVTGCRVTLTHAGFSSVMSTAGDFRKLTPLVLLEALRQAKTEVCEPMERLEIEMPDDAFAQVSGVLIQARGTIEAVERTGLAFRIACKIPAAELRAVERRLPGLTRGDAGWSSEPCGYLRVSGEPPVRPRLGPNPLNRAHYLAEIARGGEGSR